MVAARNWFPREQNPAYHRCRSRPPPRKGRGPFWILDWVAWSSRSDAHGGFWHRSLKHATGRAASWPLHCPVGSARLCRARPRHPTRYSICRLSRDGSNLPAIRRGHRADGQVLVDGHPVQIDPEEPTRILDDFGLTEASERSIDAERVVANCAASFDREAEAPCISLHWKRRSLDSCRILPITWISLDATPVAELKRCSTETPGAIASSSFLLATEESCTRPEERRQFGLWNGDCTD